MSFESLLDSKVRIWRRATTSGVVAEEKVTYAPVGADPVGFNAKLNRPTSRLTDQGPGVAPFGDRRLFMAATADVALRDLVECYDGPDTGIWEVDQPPTRPRNHHTEITAVEYHGPPPGG